jgi:transcriptional regulator with XRE-family HTH domain
VVAGLAISCPLDAAAQAVQAPVMRKSKPLAAKHDAKSPHVVDSYVGHRVRMRRLMLRMSQTDLADCVGLTFQQVQKYEKGTNRISASRLQQFANILQVPVEFFFEGSPVPTGTDTGLSEAVSPAYLSAFLSTSDGLNLVRAFLRLERPLRRRIVDLVEQIAGEDEG